MEENNFQPTVSDHVVEPHQDKKPKKSAKSKLVLIAFILLILAGAAGYWWLDQQAKAYRQEKEAEVATLQQQNKELAESLEAEKSGDMPGEGDEAIAKTKANTIAAIKSGNTAALEGYMTDKVLTVLAASEGLGSVTPAASINHITSFISDAEAPWDFELAETTLVGYGSGDYAHYFPSGAIVGKSANDKVIAFLVNSAGKINTVFTVTSADIL
jgi:cytoskeletal protein RodZ